LFSAGLNSNISGIGAFAFVDATFIELSLGFFRAWGYERFSTGFHEPTGLLSFNQNIEGGSYLYGLDIGIMLKYPFFIGQRQRFSIAPLLGVNFRTVLNRVISEYFRELRDIEGGGNFNTVQFRLGLGSDIFFSDNLFLRTSLTAGIGPAARGYSDLVNDFNETAESLGIPAASASTNPNYGLDLKIAVGFRF
jgi:hypothetical protein